MSTSPGTPTMPLLYVCLQESRHFSFVRTTWPGSKSVLIVHLNNPEAAKLFFLWHGFKLCMGAHYLGGYIKDEKSKREWLKKRTDTW